MNSRKPMDRRDFGGSDKHDWFKLHESIDREKGLSAEQSEALAKELRREGYASKKDSLGGKGRWGVYYRKYKKRSSLWKHKDVELFTIPQVMLIDWFSNRTGTIQYPYYESTVSNFIAQNPLHICGCITDDVYVWREMWLGSRTKGDTSHVDVIIETRKELWVIEAKYTTKFDGAVTPLKGAVSEVREYGKKIRKLGWWKNKTMKLAIVWAVFDDIPQSYVNFYEEHSIEEL